VASSGSARLFAALTPPASVNDQLAAWARGDAGRERSGVRVLASSSMHLTLSFLGECPMGEAESLSAALAEACGRFPSFEVQLGAPVLLPPRRPRALAVEAHDDSGRLTALQAALATGLWQALGEPPPSGRYRPHVTAARLRQDARGVMPGQPSPALSFRAVEAALYRSHLDRDGARYELLASAPLGGV
jgi:2'-5' RNA ligase